MIFYKRYIGDYRKKTARLTPLEHGVYGLLLDEFLRHRGTAALGCREIANVVGARTDADEAAVHCWKVLDRYFRQTDAGWHERAGARGNGCVRSQGGKG